MSRAFHIAAFILFIFPLCHSQNSSDTSWKAENELSLLIKTWNEYHLLLSREKYTTSSDAVNSIFFIDQTNEQGYQLQNQANLIQAEMLHSDPGLEGNLSYIHNFSPNVVLDEDNLIYQSRIQAGITWQVLGEGIVGNRYNEKVLLNEIKINEYFAENEFKENSYAPNWNLIIYIFNRKKIELLKSRKKLTEQLALAAEGLHLGKYLQREDYLKILSRKAEIEALLRIYEDYNEQFAVPTGRTLPDADSLPLLDVKYSMVYSELETTAKDSIALLYLENLQLENHLVHDIRLSTSFRYNYYNLDPGSRSFMSMSVNASVPLPFQLRQREKLADAQAKYAVHQLNQKFEGRQKELLNECYEYRYKLKQFVNFYQKYQLYLELERRMNATLQLDLLNFNPVEGLLILDDMLSVRTEMLDLRQGLYLKLLKIFTMSRQEDPKQITQRFEIPNYFTLDDQIERSVYCWSGIFSKKPVPFISEYIVFNKIDNLIISINKNDTVRSKIKKLIAGLNPSGIRIEAMFGNNSWIEGGIREKLIDLLSGFDPGTFSAIHLDIEPHTFPDWEENKESYLRKYISILEEARAYCDQNKLELCVSVPLHYPEDILKTVFALTDRIYFMAYENIRPEYVSRKIAPFGENKNKIVVALRTRDFTGRLSLEKYMIDFLHNESIFRFATHDLSGMIEMDEKSLKE